MIGFNFKHGLPGFKLIGGGGAGTMAIPFDLNVHVATFARSTKSLNFSLRCMGINTVKQFHLLQEGKGPKAATEEPKPEEVGKPKDEQVAQTNGEPPEQSKEEQTEQLTKGEEPEQPKVEQEMEQPKVEEKTEQPEVEEETEQPKVEEVSEQAKVEEEMEQPKVEEQSSHT